MILCEQPAWIILLRPEVLDAFDRTTFEQEGFWVWEGILTDAGQKQFTTSLQKLQHMNDCILRDTGWGFPSILRSVDYRHLHQSKSPRSFSWLVVAVDQSKCLAFSDRRCAHTCTSTDSSVRALHWSRAGMSLWGGDAGIFPSGVR